MGLVQLTTSLWFASVLLCEVASQNLIKNPKEQETEHLLLISEVNADNPGEDIAEYVELYHTSGRQAPLDGYHLVFYNSNGNVAYKVKDLSGFSTNSQGFFLIGASTVKPRPSVILPKNTIQNGPDAIAVYFGRGPFTEGMRVTNESLVDALVHKSKNSDRAEDLVSILTPGIEPYLEDPLFRTADESLERCQGRDSRWFFQVATPTPGADNHCVPFSQLNASTVLVSEVNLVSSPGEFEFVELQGPSSTALKDLMLVLIEGSTRKVYFAMEVSGRTSPDGLLLIGPGQAGIQVDVPFPPNSSVPLLKAGLNAVALYMGVNSSFAPGSSASATNLLDALVYTTVKSTDSELLDVLTPGRPIFYGTERFQQGNSSMNRCVCCSTTRDASVYALGKPTPRYFNNCPKKRFSQEISVCLRGAGCPQESPEQYHLEMLLAQALNKQCSCGVSPAHFREAAVACQGPDVVLTALLMAGSADQLASLLQDFSLFLESKEVVGFGEWNGTVVTSCARDANVTETPPATPDKPGATKTSPTLQAELLINEVNPDNPGAREDTEYVELFHPGLAPFDLRDYWLVLYNGKNNLAYMVVNLTGHRTDDRGYFLVGSDGVTPKPSIILPPNTIQNGVDAVALYHSPTASYQTNMALTDEGLVDAVVYKSRGSERADRLLAVLAPGQSVLHEDDSHSAQDESLSRCRSLRPRHHDSFQVTAITPFQENACPPPGSNSTEDTAHGDRSVLINEVGLANSSAPYQFIELRGTPGGSLKGYSLEFFSSQDHKPYASIPLQGTFGGDGLFVLLSQRQSRPGKGHDQLVTSSVWSDLSPQQQFHAVAVTSRTLQLRNGTLATGQSLKDVVAFTLKPSASQGPLGFLGPIHMVSRTGEWPVSLSRCSSCSTTFAVSEATPGSENSCPQESLSVVLGICLQTPNCSMWSQKNPLILAGLQRALTDSVEEGCSCGVCPCYLQGLNFTCFNSTLKLSGHLWARSPKQLQRLTEWQVDFLRSPHLFVVDGKPLRSSLSCSVSDRTVQSEASFQTWEIAVAVLGSILLALLFSGVALYFIKRQPQNYVTIEMNNHSEVISGI